MSKIKCRRCGERIAFDDSYHLDGVGSVCQECYDEGTSECMLCNERFTYRGLSHFVLFKSELRTPPGIYLVLNYPFLLCPMIGNTSVFDHDVLFVDRLPKCDSDYELSGRICKDCAKPYDEGLRRGYGRTRSWLSHNRFNRRRTWALERHHVRKTILSHPEMLLDMEMDPEDSDWVEMVERYILPADMKTYRPWLFLEHKGVRLYSVYNPQDSVWVTLDERPRSRGHGKSAIDVSSLPTWKSPDRYTYQHPKESKEALIAAISQGLLTEKGLRV